MPDSPQTKELLSVGRNCWKIARAQRIALLPDADAYFSALVYCFAQARRRIVILGWDFDSRMLLCPDDENTRLGPLLRRQVEQKPELEVHISVWRNSFVYASNSELPELFEPEWSAHSRIHFRTDDLHPVGGCRHAKIVCIDGKLAFVGGMDLTQGRWDTSDHLPDNQYRADVSGKPYPPIHDVQFLIDGPAASAVCELAGARWQELTNEELGRVESREDPWPSGVRAAVRDQSVGIARTVPAYQDREEVREIEALNEDTLAAARDCIYLENQYFTLARVAEIFADHLSRPDGPEIVIVANDDFQGVVEQYVMADNRDRLFSFLHDADRHGRLRTFHPVACPDPLYRIRLHSKVTVVDDRMFRIGSSNFNARSTGLDDEVDIVLEPDDEKGRKAVLKMRNELLAEHLGTTPQRFAGMARQKGSVIAAIETLNRGNRRLIAFDVPEWEGGPLLAPGSRLLDPRGPLSLEDVLKTLKPT